MSPARGARRRADPRRPTPRQRPLGAPGRVLELAETFDDGVRREVVEETGVHVEVERLTGVYKNVARGIVVLVFRLPTCRG